MMDHTVPEVELVDVLIAGCALFPGDSEDDPPMVMRDLPVFVVSLPWEEVEEEFSNWGFIEDLSFRMVVTTDCAVLQVTLYDPYVCFALRVPLPDYQEAIEQALECGWLGFQSEDDISIALVRCGD